jgi:hypothetical protein
MSEATHRVCDLGQDARCSLAHLDEIQQGHDLALNL